MLDSRVEVRDILRRRGRRRTQVENVCRDSIEMLSTALAMEEKGREFYEKAASECKNDLGVDLFRQLAADEIRHITAIKEISRSIESCGRFAEGWESCGGEHADVAAFFDALAARHGTAMRCEAGDMDAVEVAIDMELRAIMFYMQRLGKTSDPAERRFLHAVVAEEHSHHAALTDMRFYLTNPEAYFAEKERAGLDGA
jgi:rubrerythrin